MSPDSYKTIRRATQQMLDGWEGRDVDCSRTTSGVEVGVAFCQQVIVRRL